MVFLLIKQRRIIVKRIIMLVLAVAMLSPHFASAFTVGRSGQSGEDHVYLRKQFLNKNVYPYKVDWVQIRINFIPPKIKMRSEEERFSGKIAQRYENARHSFLIVMENNDWLRAGRFQSGRSRVADGYLRLDDDYEPKFILSLNGLEKGIYYNPKMNFGGYFVTVNQKILRRLANAGFIPYQR